MKLDHIGKIRGNIAISTAIKSANILDGAYRSIHKGKSLNFEELREYNLGDSVKDIDWKASARSMNILVREYIADKKHNIFFVLDSKYAMNANSTLDDIKRDVAIEVAGTLAYLAYKSGDYIGALYINKDEPKFFPFKQTLFSIENFLTFYDEDLKNQKIKQKFTNSINYSLKYLTDYLNKRAVIFIITDLAGMEEISEEYLKTLSYRNDIMLIVVKDIDLYESKSYDIDKRKYFSSMFLKNKHLVRIEQEEKQKVYDEYEKLFSRYKITTIMVDSRDNVIPKVVELLERHSYANTR